MSAARRTDGRGQIRRAHSSPYARPQSSGWSLRKLLEPLRRRVFGQPVENENQGSRGRQFPRSPSPEGVEVTDEGSYMVLSEPTDELGSEPPRSPSTSTSPKRPVPSEGPSACATLENVIEFLTDAAGLSLKREEAHWVASLIQKCINGERLVSQSLLQSIGRPLGAIEVEGMVSLLHKSLSYGKPEPFRFQSATPSRGVSTSVPSTSISTPGKTLKRNPNGVYRWEGAGSARQALKRNRYSSPAFGTPRLTPDKFQADGDKKRRKVDEPFTAAFLNDSSNTPKLPFPITSHPTPHTNSANSTPKITVSASPSKLRTPTVAKPTTPSQPSPLRQAWSGSPSSSQEDLSHFEHSISTPPPPRQSKAANLVSEIIKEVTPAKKPDLSNPYQTASPISKVGPPRRSTRRSRATGKPSVPVNGKNADEQADTSATAEQVRDIPAQAIIEATLPKGSKRSRPPPNMAKSSFLEASSSYDGPIEEEADKTPEQTRSVFSSASRVKDVEMDSDAATEKSASSSLFGSHSTPSAPLANSLPSFNSLKSATAPSRPSKLRYSYQPEGDSTPGSPTSDPEVKEGEFKAPPPPTTTSFFNLPSIPSTSKSSKSSGVASSSKMDEDTSSPAAKFDPKTRALEMDPNSLPTFTFTISFKSDTLHWKQREEAKSKSISIVPIFDFSQSSLTADKKPTEALAPNSDIWTCSLCMLKNPTSAKDKCTICEAPRPEIQRGAPSLAAFDWSAAGMKAPAPSGGSTWTCSMCMRSNPASATEKCTVCETLREDVKKAAPAVIAFDWSAAGMKAPVTAAAWTCSICMLSNPESAKDKCTVCEGPRFGASASTSTAPALKTFDWTAAGLKAPSTSNASWTCSTCMLTNPASASAKCTVCDAPR